MHLELKDTLEFDSALPHNQLIVYFIADGGTSKIEPLKLFLNANVMLHNCTETTQW